MSVASGAYDRSSIGEELGGEGKGELLARVCAVKQVCVLRTPPRQAPHRAPGPKPFSPRPQELADWRHRVGAQVRCHRGEVAELQEVLTAEMAGLRAELAVARARIRRELDASQALLASLQAAKEAEREG